MLNRLKNHKVYLAGAIDRCPDLGKTWRVSLTPQLQSLDIVVLDPLNKPLKDNDESDISLREYRKKLKAEGNYDEFSRIIKRIRQVDLRMVDISDFMIAAIDVNLHMCGTYEEITWANRCKKPVFLLCESKHNVPDWLFGTLPHKYFFETVYELMAYLTRVNNGLEDDNSRWIFFEHP